MDFLSAEDFLDHLELHPNGSFVLVKRDQPPQPVVVALPEPPEPEEPPSHSPIILPEMLQNQIKVSSASLGSVESLELQCSDSF